MGTDDNIVTGTVRNWRYRHISTLLHLHSVPFYPFRSNFSKSASKQEMETSLAGKGDEKKKTPRLLTDVRLSLIMLSSWDCAWAGFRPVLNSISEAVGNVWAARWGLNWRDIDSTGTNQKSRPMVLPKQIVKSLLHPTFFFWLGVRDGDGRRGFYKPVLANVVLDSPTPVFPLWCENRLSHTDHSSGVKSHISFLVWSFFREADVPGHSVAAGVPPRRDSGGGVWRHQLAGARGGVVLPGQGDHWGAPQ